MLNQPLDLKYTVTLTVGLIVSQVTFKDLSVSVCTCNSCVLVSGHVDLYIRPLSTVRLSSDRDRWIRGRIMK